MPFDSSVDSATAGHPLWVRVWRPLFGAMMVGLVIVAGLYTYNFMQSAVEPLSASESAAENSPVKYGDALVVRRKFKRTKLCLVNVDRFVFREPENLLVRRERLPSGYQPLGESESRSLLKTKVDGEDLTPGKYILRQYFHSDCGFRLFTVELPQVAFEVIE